MSGSGGGGGYCDFCLGSVNMISVDLERFSVKLFCSDHFSRHVRLSHLLMSSYNIIALL